MSKCRNVCCVHNSPGRLSSPCPVPATGNRGGGKSPVLLLSRLPKNQGCKGRLVSIGLCQRAPLPAGREPACPGWPSGATLGYLLGTLPTGSALVQLCPCSLAVPHSFRHPLPLRGLGEPGHLPSSSVPRLLALDPSSCTHLPPPGPGTDLHLSTARRGSCGLIPQGTAWNQKAVPEISSTRIGEILLRTCLLAPAKRGEPGC